MSGLEPRLSSSTKTIGQQIKDNARQLQNMQKEVIFVIQVLTALYNYLPTDAMDSKSLAGLKGKLDRRLVEKVIER